MVMLLSSTAFGASANSPVSSISTSAQAVSLPALHNRPVPSLTPAYNQPKPGPWIDCTVRELNTSHPLTPGSDHDSDLESPLGTTSALLVPGRKDTLVTQIGGGDSYFKRTASSYMARPLPNLPSANSLPKTRSDVATPVLKPTARRPVTPARGNQSSFTYPHFRKQTQAESFYPPENYAKRAETEPTSDGQPLQPTPRFFVTEAKPIEWIHESRPLLRQYRSNTEPAFPSPDATEISFKARSSSLKLPENLQNTQTSVLPSSTHNLIPSPVPRSATPQVRPRRPSAAEVLAAQGTGGPMKLVSGPDRAFQVQIAQAPGIESQQAVKWIKKEDKQRRHLQRELERERAVSEARFRNNVPNLALDTDEVIARWVNHPKSSRPSLDSPTINRPHPLRGFVDRERAQSADRAGQTSQSILNEHFEFETERGRPRQRQYTAPLLYVQQHDSGQAPSTDWDVPSAQGPLQVRGSAFKPFSSELDDAALVQLGRLRDAAEIREASLASERQQFLGVKPLPPPPPQNPPEKVGTDRGRQLTSRSSSPFARLAALVKKGS